MRNQDGSHTSELPNCVSTRPMSDELLSAEESARRLGISKTSLYAWLGLSDIGELVIRGQPVTIQYFQGGPKGQGRIRIEAQEIERLRDAMRVRPQNRHQRRPPVRLSQYPGITVPLGRPRD